MLRRVRELRARLGLVRLARPEARRLRAAGTEDALVLAEVVTRCSRLRLSPDERRWRERIERERERLGGSTETVPRVNKDPMSVAYMATRASQPWWGGRMLYAAVRAFRPTRGVELGTCLGISTAYQAAALAEDGAGRLVGLELHGPLAANAEEVWKNVGLDNVEVQVGKFTDTLEPLLAASPMDYAYVDGDHYEEPTVAYFQALHRHCTRRSLLVFDDVRWSAEMERAWQRIRTDPAVTAYADLGRIGFVIVHPAG